MDRAGAETMLMNLYRHTDRNKIQFDFITFTDETGDYDAEIIALGGKVIPIIASNPITRMLKLKKFLQRHPEYTIVHAHMSLSNAFHLLAAKNAGVKHLISHAHSTKNGKRGIVEKIYEKWALITNRHIATYKIACGELAAQYLFGTTRNVLLLPNAVDIQEMVTVAENSRDYINREFSDNGLKIIQVGRLYKVKNHTFSLKIAEELKKRQVNFTIYIIGQGPLEKDLKQQAQDTSLLDNVKFLGLRTDITELMASADYMIMPSLSEGFPVVLVESQTVRLMTIVSKEVPAEVDLGIGLVDFLPIDSAVEWADHLLENKQSNISNEEIINVLKSGGFDVALSAEKLAKMYMSL
ncbi:glycosyltransferase family 1 protein [Psychrobacter frigidicola]|uniref:Glycosyltransferase family 1 protein n=2 Tax=Psychrobacter frigidicola TaxID=45611 RepID=A0A5C7A776_9GAMM|nr:glycosyltransferase family 1 protein [Psychrobacter frigidicola]